MRFLLLSSLALCSLSMSFTAARAQDTQGDTGPVEVAKYVDIQPGQEKAALAALQKYRAAARAEDGNARELILEEGGRPSRFLIVEKWKDVPAYKAHLDASAVTQLDTDLAAIRRAPNDERANSDFLAEDGGTPPSSAVFAVTHVDVNPPNRPKTEDALKALVEASRKEDGALAFNVFRPQTALNHFTLFEVWSDSKTFEAHGQAPAAVAFRRSVAPLIGALYDERIYRLVE
jgi:quinol monooxygenase YgiN